MSSIDALSEVIVEFEGRPLAGASIQSLGEVSVKHRLSLPSQCELAFYQPPAELLDSRSVQPGASFAVRVAGQPTPIFRGEVTASEVAYPPSRRVELRLRGYDLLHRLRQRQPLRSHAQVTAADLAEELVSDLGLTVQADERGPLHRELFQLGQTDFDLLAQTTQDCGLYFQLQGRRLRLFSLQGLGAPLPLELGTSLVEARLEINSASVCRKVSASGLDVHSAAIQQGEASRPRTGRSDPAPAAPGAEANGHQPSLVDQMVENSQHAEGLAQADLDRRLARQASFWGLARGNAELAPGRRVELHGVSDRYCATYTLAQVTHSVDRDNGFVSSLSTVLPPLASERGQAGASLGLVTRVDDPEGRGRVSVSFPAYGGLQAQWIPVLLPAAGKGKGIVALPDVGDRVLVLFAGRSRSQGVVLGGLYAGEGPPDDGVSGGETRRFNFLTPGGQRIRLDDERRELRLDCSDGSYLELSPKRVRLHSERNLEIRAPGKRLRFGASSIDFDRM